MALLVDLIILIDGKTSESSVGYSCLVLTTSVTGDRVIMRVISLISILHARSFMADIDRLYLLVT